MPPIATNKPRSHLRVTTESLHNFSSTKLNAEATQRSVAMDTIGTSIGPVPPREFLDRLLPKNGPLRRRVAKDTFKTVRPGKGKSKKRGEFAMYDKFVSRILCCLLSMITNICNR